MIRKRIRLGYLSGNKLNTINYGHVLNSEKFCKSSGNIFGLSVDIPNKVGAHIRYKELGSMSIQDRKVIEIGLHTISNYTNKYSLKVIAVIGIIAALLTQIISDSQ
ncbi:hypothetical protein N9L92_00560 [Saprospiraceae bacterium]|nr:hypothetical protein [Saprospiraceae bacterium]